ncbi:MAG: hypothetical protein KGQ41_01790 [Alphaproteobacteria bacterium]|nr:hypothetical protein [Alphaproteobacteria bacterium]
MSQKRVVVDLCEELAKRVAAMGAEQPVAAPARTIFDPDPDEDAPRPDPAGLSLAAFMLYADKRDGAYIRTLGPTFFNAPDVPRFTELKGVKILMGRPIFQFLGAVADDDLERAMKHLLLSGPQIRPYLNVPSFFFWLGSSDAAFITPAHAVRSVEMAHFLARNVGVRFNVPDSEGRLPQLYWARYAKDYMLFPYGEQMLAMDMSQGGIMQDEAHEPFVQPIWRAIEGESETAAHGLGLCAGAAINRPRPRDWGRFTPLMIQAVKTDLALANRDGKRLRAAYRTATALARSPNIAWDAQDYEGYTVNDIPLDARIRQLIAEARANPWPSEPLGFRAKLA